MRWKEQLNRVIFIPRDFFSLYNRKQKTSGSDIFCQLKMILKPIEFPKFFLYTGIIYLLFLAKVNESLKCYKCLSLDCDIDESEDKGQNFENRKLCESIRKHIVQSLETYYDYGESKYVPPCPDVDEQLQWIHMQNSVKDCRGIPEGPTCSLGRIQINTTDSRTGEVLSINHATMLGCMTSVLLQAMKKTMERQMVCNYITLSSSAQSPFSHTMEMENCPKITDYCKERSFCVPFSQSVVKPFITNRTDRSFEAGAIIAIISVIIVLILVVIGASFCKNPLGRATNYSPAQIQKVAKLPPSDEIVPL